MNEFLFSFLITKFYTNNETIIYIPKDIEIYIEIPNCFKNYLSQFGILNIFPRENITIDNMPKLDLPKKTIEIFNRMIELNSNEEIEEKFLKKYMDNTKNYSYHQIISFIKLFKSQYSKFESKIFFSAIKKDKNGKVIEKKDITDDCIRDFAQSTKYFINSGFNELLMKKNEEKDMEKSGKDSIDLLSEIYDNDLKNTVFNIPLIFIIKEKMEADPLIIPKTTSRLYNSSEAFLLRLKQVLNLPNEVEKDTEIELEKDKDKGAGKEKTKEKLRSLISILNYKSDNYVITNDNFKKMVLLVYRIIADIPVILMGETGCGKTALIKKLSQILNNGEIVVEIINIHPGITDKYICNKMEEMNEKAKKQNKELWVFFDEINTCLSMSLLTEIFINKTFNGEKLNDNIRLIGACNPYRRRKKGFERCGYGRETDNNKELVYLVQPLPQSLLNYVFSFGSLNPDDEKKYIYSIIGKLFDKGEEELHEATKEVIFNCHKYLRDTFDPSVVSLREISRFYKIVSFFQKYLTIKRKCEEDKDNDSIEDDKEKLDEQNIDNTKDKTGMEKFDKIISLICSVYLCYYIRLIDDKKRQEFNVQLRQPLINLVNSAKIIEDIKVDEKVDKFKDDKEDDTKKKDDLVYKINHRTLRNFMHDFDIKKFSDFLSLEEDYLLDKIELKKGIGKNDMLKENVFLLFVSVITKIPLIIVGKPGTGKSLSSQLIYNSMRGKYSKNKFFRQFPQIILTYFQGSESTIPEDIDKLFEIAEHKLEFYKNNEEFKNEKLPISMILFDELGLAEKSKSNPLKALHSKLEYDGNEEGVSFIGISNYSLDAAKVNRAINLSVPNLEDKIDQLISTSKSIVKRISEDLSNLKIFEILARAYYEYKKELNFIKELIVLKQYNEKEKEKGRTIDIKKTAFGEIKLKDEFIKLLEKEKKIKLDFHSNRDLYNYIRGIANKASRLSSFDESELKNIINNCIERNFGGIDYKIDIDFDLKLNDIEKDIESLKQILKEKIPEKKRGNRNEKKNEKNEDIRVSSVFLFKKIYNRVCETQKENNYQLDPKEVLEYDLNRCIINNIADSDSRYLLLEIKSSLVSLIFQNIKIQNSDKEIVFIDGSPFPDDDNNEYKFIKVREIQENANTDKLTIMQNLDKIQPFLYDLYNMNYIVKDEENCVRICLDSFSEQLTPVNELFRIIILVDRKFINNIDFAFLNRLEKMKISFEKLLDDDQKNFARNITNDIDFERHIESHKVNYELKDLLINCGKEEIQGLIYYETKKRNNKLDKKNIEEIINNKLIKILCQDIISILPKGHKIKELYLNEKKYYNLISYINDLKEDSPKISIVYTFNSIAAAIKNINNDMKISISEIKKEEKLDSSIREIKYKNESKYLSTTEGKKNIIYINFDQFNSIKIQFISEYIKKNYKNDNYKYIFIIHIQRNFNLQTSNVIYSIPDIDSDIEQLFIDNLNAENIKFKELLKKDIKNIMNDNSKYMNLNNEFKKLLSNFVYKSLNGKRTQDNVSSFNIKDMSRTGIMVSNLKQKDNNYSNEILKYMENNISFKEKIIDKAKNFISEDQNAEGNSQKIIDRIMNSHYIGKNSLDIISCLLNYIKEEIFGKYLKYIFSYLEDNNILTTLIEIQNDKNNEIGGNIINKLIEDSLDMITYDDKKKLNPKFLYNYKIPGFYNSYINLSKYINDNIIVDYFNCEKNLRKYEAKANKEKKKNEFFKKEKELLSSVYDYITNNDKFLFDNIEKIDTNIILKDYISFYLEKYDLKNEINNNLVELLLNLRYNPEKNNIIKDNDSGPVKIMLIKIIWIETNVNYILNILNIYSHAEKLFNDNDKDKLFEMIKNKIYDEDRSIKYITNETRNPEYTKEVNECYYVFLASLCLCITEDELELSELELENNLISVDHYLEVLKKINLCLQDLNTTLNISLNEMFIIDELIVIIELQKLKKINIKKIKEIRKLLRDNTFIIQKDHPDKYTELIVNFQNIYEKLIEEKIKEIKTEEDKIYDNKYYDMLKYIFLKEINKIIEQNYRVKIFEKLIREKEIIKRSSDIFQILLKKTIKTGKEEKDGFKNNLSALKSGDEIVKLIENNLLDIKEDNYFSLQETILSFFEKNAIIYLKNALYPEKEADNIYIDEGTPLDIFEDCVKFLVKYNFTDKLSGEIKHIRKLLCIAYIKVYCYTFIKMIDDNNPKLKDPLSIVNLLEKMKEKDNKMNEIIKLYIYKTIYNQNQKQLDVFLNRNKKKKYKFDKYKGFKDFFKFEEEETINYGFETLDKDYDEFYNKIEKFKKDGFKKKIKKNDIIEEESDDSESFIDNFFNAGNLLILSKLKKSDFETSEVYENFYNNICKSLFEGKEKLSRFIEYLFNPKKYEEIKKYGINSSNIESLLYGYRYCLNCVSEIPDDDNGKENLIYASLYDRNKISYLIEKCYPGSNPEDEPKYQLLNQIINHFKEKPNDGCYVCLCEKGYYHSVLTGFPGDNEKDMPCPNCKQPIGAIYEEGEFGKECKIINRKGYMRIFKDKDDIEKTKENNNKKIQQINYMTIEEFKNEYIYPLYKEDKGLHRIKENYFKKDDKMVRNLSQISYRLLNYILYSHLFFAKLYTGVSENFDRYLPEKMNWGETLNECWILLKNELSKKDINFIEIFMNFTFKDLYNKINGEECIDDYDSLIDFEDKLEELIQKKIKISQDECKKYKESINEKSKDKNSFVSMLTEKYDSTNYDKEKYPNYDNFYYTDYLDEENISKLLNHKDKDKYLILNRYLEYAEAEKRNENKKKKEDNDFYSLDNLNTFISVINLFNEKYSHLISRDFASSKILEDDELYRGNTKLIDKFIKYFNKLKESENKKNKEKVDNDKKKANKHKKEKKKDDKKDDDKKNKDKKNDDKDVLKLSVKNHLTDFLLDPETEYGKAYKIILQKFIERQNMELTDLLDKKIISGKLDINSSNKINIQQIKEDEIFTFNIPEKFSFINETSNSSYRKIIDNKNYEIYNKYEIDFDSIEERMTNLLLKNKKLLKDDIIEFSYNNELFTNEISNEITTFKENYNIEEITDDDKAIIYKYIDTVAGNKDLFKKIIEDFMTLIKYLINRKEENVMISEIISKIENNVSQEFSQIFDKKNYLTVYKTPGIFDCFLKLVFNDIKEEIEEYNLEFKDKEKEQKLKDELDNYFETNEEKDDDNNNDENKNNKIINKDNLSSALKWFMAIVLFGENDKENKIKSNKKNIVTYLNAPDLWDREIYKQLPQLVEDLNGLKTFNIQINRIVWFYDYLSEEEDNDNYIKNIEEYIKKKEQKQKPPEDINKVNNKDDDETDSENEKSKSGSDTESEHNDDDDEGD